MGAYREQLLRETYGGGSSETFGRSAQEEPSRPLTLFKLKFTVCLLLFAGFAYLNYTGGTVLGISAEQIVEAVTDNELQTELSRLAESWN